MSGYVAPRPPWRPEGPSHRRLYEIIRKIMEGPHRSGSGVVSQIIRPGEIRLKGRPERVLVAGNALPRVGQALPWLAAGNGLLIASYNLRRRYPQMLDGTLTKRQWEQVLVASDVDPFDGQPVHRDSSGRYWVKNYGTFSWQEAEHFTVSPWHATDSPLLSGATECELGVIDPDTLLVVEASGAGLVGGRVHIGPDTAALSGDAFFSVFPADQQYEGVILEREVIRGPDGHFHLATWCPSPYADDGVWELYAISDAPDDPSAWTWISQTHWPEDGVDLPSYPVLTRVGEAVLCFRIGYRYIDGVYHGSVSYRVFSGGGWGPRQETSFAPTYGASGSFTALGVEPNEMHVSYVDVDGGLVWCKGTFEGGAISWGTPVPLLAGGVGAAALYRNYRDGSPPVAAFALEATWGTSQFRHLGLPPEDWESDLLDGSEYLPAWSRWDQPALRAGGGRAGADPLDGFVAWVTHTHGTGELYAARIVAEDT